MPGGFEPDSGRGQAVKRFKADRIRRALLFRSGLLGPLQTTIAPPTALHSACLVQRALDEVQRARSSGTEPAGRALALRPLVRLEKGGETVQLALYKTNKARRSARLHRRDVLVRSRPSRRS